MPLPFVVSREASSSSRQILNGLSGRRRDAPRPAGCLREQMMPFMQRRLRLTRSPVEFHGKSSGMVLGRAFQSSRWMILAGGESAASGGRAASPLPCLWLPRGTGLSRGRMPNSSQCPRHAALPTALFHAKRWPKSADQGLLTARLSPRATWDVSQAEFRCRICGRSRGSKWVHVNRHWVAPLSEVSTSLTLRTTIDVNAAGQSPSWMTAQPSGR